MTHWVYYDKSIDGESYFDRREVCTCARGETHWAISDTPGPTGTVAHCASEDEKQRGGQ